MKDLTTGLGDGGHRLHEWFWTDADDDKGVPGRPAGVNGQVFDEMMATGAVVAGRGTFDGQGRRLFDDSGPEHIELERTRIIEGEAGVTHMHYRVKR